MTATTINEKTVKWAIETQKITDYDILILQHTEYEVSQIIELLRIQAENKELFIAAYMTLKAIEKYNTITHTLLYCNTTKSSDLLANYVRLIVKSKHLHINLEEFYIKALHSGTGKLEAEIYKFKRAKYGIIACVYIFGEGFNLPRLNYDI